MSPRLDHYAREINATGLVVRGAFHVEEDDGVPQPGSQARSLILIGNAGPSFWRAFRESPEYADGRPHPLDRWSERVITGLGCRLRALPVFPFQGPPYYPFLRWARRAESVSPSPLGMLIHPDYGLWHAYRGALVVDGHLQDLPPEIRAASPCLTCEDQPCLHACPVDAFDGSGFDVERCTSHLSGTNACSGEGCLARDACPAGKAFRYMREQHCFHLAAFLRARVGDRD
jgi:hypothetical protein